MVFRQQITINSLKYDNKIRRSWSADLILQEQSLLVFLGVFDIEINHPQLGNIRRGTQSYEYYWLDRWYNVFRFHEPDGSLRNYYCNINMPPIFQNGVLDYIDLDIDIVVWPDFSYEVLDIDEFDQNAQTFSYPREVHLNACRALDEVKELISFRNFPFDYASKAEAG